MGLGRGKKVYKMGLPAFPWEGVHKYDGLLGGDNVYKMGLPSFPWEGVHKYDGHGEVYKMRRSNLRVLCHFFALWLAPLQ